jgi:hypothetical protein
MQVIRHEAVRKNFEVVFLAGTQHLRRQQGHYVGLRKRGLLVRGAEGQ